MPRPTKTEIDADILDGAAGLFARHGFDRTSVQQIADALGYSKAGLLHHYPSKKALFDAVMTRYQAEIGQTLADVRAQPAGIVRDRALVERVIDFAFTRPGMAALAEHLSRQEPSGDPRFTELGLELIAALGVDLHAPDMNRLARALSALTGASYTARLAVTMGLEREWRAALIAAAMDGLGHAGDPAG